MSDRFGGGPTGTTPRDAAIPGQRATPQLSGRLGSGIVPNLTGTPNRRGLPASGAVALALGAGMGGGAVDVLTGSGLRALFAVSFVLGCMAAAAVVRRQSLLAAVVTPPLAYVALAMAAAEVQRDSSSTSWLMRQIFELLTALMTGAPVLLAATLSAAAVALARVLVRRSPPVIQLPPR